MKLARYWSRDTGEAGGMRVVARGWSDESVDAARARARDIARRVAERLMVNPGIRNQYQYGDRPLPEPVLREFSGAAVTRNAYGALVLNTDDLMFVDIDVELHDAAAGPENLVSKVFSLFAKPAPAATAAPPAHPVLDSVQRVAERHGLSARVYKTAAGCRAIITDRKFQAGSAEAEALLREFGADPMYVRLCRLQASFRARLTPKPWRCNFRQPAEAFPFETPQAQANFQRWEEEYNRRAGNFATCQFLTAVGQGRTEAAFADLIGYHDQETKAGSAQPLA